MAFILPVIGIGERRVSVIRTNTQKQAPIMRPKLLGYAEVFPTWDWDIGCSAPLLSRHSRDF